MYFQERSHLQQSGLRSIEPKSCLQPPTKSVILSSFDCHTGQVLILVRSILGMASLPLIVCKCKPCRFSFNSVKTSYIMHVLQSIKGPDTLGCTCILKIATGCVTYLQHKPNDTLFKRPAARSSAALLFLPAPPSYC